MLPLPCTITTLWFSILSLKTVNYIELTHAHILSRPNCKRFCISFIVVSNYGWMLIWINWFWYLFVCTYMSMCLLGHVYNFKEDNHIHPHQHTNTPTAIPNILNAIADKHLIPKKNGMSKTTAMKIGMRRCDDVWLHTKWQSTSQLSKRQSWYPVYLIKKYSHI